MEQLVRASGKAPTKVNKNNFLRFFIVLTIEEIKRRSMLLQTLVLFGSLDFNID